jgi:hypothetical protein
VNFAISSLALIFLQEYKLTVSSKCSGGEHDSTGLRAKQKLITPLLRCASPEQLRFTANFLRRHSKTKRGAIGSPFCIFGQAKNYSPQLLLGFCGQLLRSLMIVAVMRNLAMVVPALPRVPVIMPVVRRRAIRALWLGRTRCRQGGGNRQHEQC